MACAEGNFNARICVLELAVNQIASTSAHPPFTLSYSGSSFAYDSAAQTGNIPVPVIPATPFPEVAVTADASSRAALAPQGPRQLLVQTSDATNGNYSIWAATGSSPGNWTLKVASLAAQNSNAVSITGGAISGITDLAVADGGTGASTGAGARQNLAISTAAPVAAVINWLVSDNFSQAVLSNTVFSFTNVADGLSITLALSASSSISVGWPAGVKWPNNTTPAAPVSGTTTLYGFTSVGGVIFGSYNAGYPA